MKQLSTVVSAIALAALAASCTSEKERYVDLSTGKVIEVEKDEKTGVVVNKATRQPVYIYVDTQKKDTIYGKTGEVINGHIILDDNRQYVYDGDIKMEVNENSMEYKDGEQKIEIEKDGDIKIKQGDSKLKIDGETGERKVKIDD